MIRKKFLKIEIIRWGTMNQEEGKEQEMRRRMENGRKEGKR